MWRNYHTNELNLTIVIEWSAMAAMAAGGRLPIEPFPVAKSSTVSIEKTFRAMSGSVALRTRKKKK